jgi:hypothetical protein
MTLHILPILPIHVEYIYKNNPSKLEVNSHGITNIRCSVNRIRWKV